MEYPELKKTVLAAYHKWQPQSILIEDKASGQSLIQDYRRECKLPIIAISPTLDKITRFASATPLFEAGRVFVPDAAIWSDGYLAELLSFPGGSNDDQVDSTLQFLNYARSRKTNEAQIRVI